MHIWEAIQKTTWQEVQHHLLVNCEALLIHLYEDLYHTLQKRPVSSDTPTLPLSITIRAVEDSHVYDIYGVKRGDTHGYTLSLSTWDEWMHYTLSAETLEKFSLGEIVAHCLWEMTYYGVTEEDVIRKRQDLLIAKEHIHETYIEDTTTCPFCLGKRKNENDEMCLSCNEDGLITFITL